jgi:hypothetical protein
MATIDNLPAELILNVFQRLTKHQASLASLARVARKYRPIAEEVLYKSPIVPDAESVVSSVQLFLQTLIARLDLAARVKKLFLPTVRQFDAHSAACKQPHCVCGP